MKNARSIGKVLIRPAMIVLPFLAGALFQYFTGTSWKTESGLDVSSLCIRCALMIMFFTMCLRIHMQDIKPRSSHINILAANILVGLGGYIIFHLLGMETLALAAFFTGITPTANAAPVLMSFLHGRVGYVMTGFVITNVSISILLVWLIPLLTGNMNASFVQDVFFQIAFLICVPAAAAAILRSVWSGAVKLPAKCGMFNLGLWSFTLFVIASRTTEYFRMNTSAELSDIAEAGLVSLGICAVNFTLGHFIVPRKYTREGSQTLGQKNTTFTIFLALSFGGPCGAVVALGPTFYVLWHNTWNAFQLFMHDKRKLK